MTKVDKLGRREGIIIGILLYLLAIFISAFSGVGYFYVISTNSSFILSIFMSTAFSSWTMSFILIIIIFLTKSKEEKK